MHLKHQLQGKRRYAAKGKPGETKFKIKNIILNDPACQSDKKPIAYIKNQLGLSYKTVKAHYGHLVSSEPTLVNYLTHPPDEESKASSKKQADASSPENPFSQTSHPDKNKGKALPSSPRSSSFSQQGNHADSDSDTKVGDCLYDEGIRWFAVDENLNLRRKVGKGSRYTPGAYEVYDTNKPFSS